MITAIMSAIHVDERGGTHREHRGDRRRHLGDTAIGRDDSNVDGDDRGDDVNHTNGGPQDIHDHSPDDSVLIRRSQTPIASLRRDSRVIAALEHVIPSDPHATSRERASIPM
jgi:hypothetical protein